MTIQLPETGLVFWPVGTGDSTTICVNKNTIIQVDLNNMKKSESEDDPHAQILEELIKILPKKDGKPFLSLFILTHPDEDHCRGFKDLLSKVLIGEIWHTPRVFREYKKDQCEDAKSFRDEATRRTKIMISNKGNLVDGDRLRLVGFDELLKEEKYLGFPRSAFSIPGEIVSMINGINVFNNFEAFIQAPFKDDSAGERNETSLAMQITIKNNAAEGKALLLGDLSYPTLRKIFDYPIGNVAWDVFLAPHHCSKLVMYKKNENGEDELQQDILDDIKKAAGDIGYIISSSDPIPRKNNTGDNPPHAKAKSRYEEIVPNDFLCTMEHPNEKNPEPIIFDLSSDNLTYVEPSGEKKTYTEKLGLAIASARGEHEPPTKSTGFGNE